MLAEPEDYRWSGYGANALGAHDPLIRAHPNYVALGGDAAQAPQRSAGHARIVRLRELHSDPRLLPAPVLLPGRLRDVVASPRATPRLMRRDEMA